jgi:hypothetical protein
MEELGSELINQGSYVELTRKESYFHADGLTLTLIKLYGGLGGEIPNRTAFPAARIGCP